jgi:hypothetical protein
MYLCYGWRRFARAHAIEVGHFIGIKYEGHDMLIVAATRPCAATTRA